VSIVVAWMATMTTGAKMKNSYMPKSKNQQHLTPDVVYDKLEQITTFSKFEFYDPCPPDTPYKAPCFFNGLYGDWERYNYVNPPYAVATLRLFYNKAKEQAAKGKTSYMLLPSKTDQDWFHDIILQDYYIIWFRGRLKFKGNKDSSMGGHFLVMIN